ncbi:MAG: DUF2442 domain-containing protein [Rhodanobacteraceae bacterium]|nr:MAG: DUF2442 domain-containing protein [Rhodanobacteraceae bacterium]
MDSLRTLKSVKPLSDATLRLRWSDGTAADLDLSDLLKKRAFKSLHGSAFQHARLDEWGHSVEWPNGIAIGADALWRRTLLARGREDAVTFMDWRLAHGLSLSEAAEALGLSRRMVAYYSSGTKAVPKTVLLACRGWEHTRDAA